MSPRLTLPRLLALLLVLLCFASARPARRGGRLRHARQGRTAREHAAGERRALSRRAAQQTPGPDGQAVVGGATDHPFPATGSGGGETPDSWMITGNGINVSDTNPQGWYVRVTNDGSRGGEHDFTVFPPASAAIAHS